MAGKRPTRSQLRSRRRALNSYLLSTESSYADLAKKFGVREETVKKFLGKDTKQIRAKYNQTPGYQKLYNAAAKNRHTSDVRRAAKEEGKRYVEIPPLHRQFIPPRVVQIRRKAGNLTKAQATEKRSLLARATQLREYARNVERDYNAVVNRREQAALKFQRDSIAKGRPTGLYAFLDTAPDEDAIEEYINDVSEDYHLTADQVAALSARIAKYLGYGT